MLRSSKLSVTQESYVMSPFLPRSSSRQPGMLLDHLWFVEFHAAFSNFKKYSCRRHISPLSTPSSINSMSVRLFVRVPLCHSEKLGHNPDWRVVMANYVCIYLWLWIIFFKLKEHANKLTIIWKKDAYLVLYWRWRKNLKYFSSSLPSLSIYCQKKERRRVKFITI